MDYFFVVLLTVTVIFGGKAIYDWKKNRSPRLNLDDLEVERAQYIQDNFEKALADFNYLESIQKSLPEREFSIQIRQMQRIAKNLLKYLEKNPEKISLAQKFISYYQDRAVKIVQQYLELEETRLSTEKIQDLKERMRATLATLSNAYQEQFEHVINDRIIATSAELTVMEQQLDAAGIPKKSPEIKNDEVRVDKDLLGQPIENRVSNGKFFPRGIQRRGYSQDSLTSWFRFPEEDRSRIVERKLIQSALAIFLGSFGAHKFYQGKTFQGVLYLLFALSTLPALIGFIEGVRYLFMPVEDFYNQYMRDKDLQFKNDGTR